MNKYHKHYSKASSRGFTIIEVVLVLAIAGLIFLMVFIALPALQRGQRDTQRKEDLARVSVQLTNYQASSQGGIPTDGASLSNFVKGYLNGTPDQYGGTAGSGYVDPSGGNYVVHIQKAPSAVGQIGYYNGSSCDAGGTDGVSSSNAARDYALTIALENQSAPFCIDNKS